MTDRLQLVAFDIGSTTSCALAASASREKNGVTGKSEIGDAKVTFKSERVFTPFADALIDEARMTALVDRWIGDANLDLSRPMAGGAIITGLAARAPNARELVAAFRRRVPRLLVSVTSDPGLESWLAFMGSCSELSASLPDETFLNIDLGGGTANFARGKAGAVVSTDCFWIGARHFEFEPGTYRIRKLSKEARALLKRLGIARRSGETLESSELRKVLDFYVKALETAVRDQRKKAESELHITFSGGMGELIYDAARGAVKSTTFYGDLGVDLANRILASPLLSSWVRREPPSNSAQNRGRATLYGLALHNTEVSGASLFLSEPDLFPLRDLPILGKVSPGENSAQVLGMIKQARNIPGGACIQVDAGFETADKIKRLALQFAAALRSARFPKAVPLVVLMPGNQGKSFGCYATEWGRLPAKFAVVDELPTRRAHFACLAPTENSTVLVSYYGYGLKC